MAFINEIYRNKKILREKATKKFVHLNGAIEFNKTCLTNESSISIVTIIFINKKVIMIECLLMQHQL